MVADCSFPEVALLKTFKGIGEASAIGIMLEIQNVERFASAKKIASFYGVHPSFKISGDGSSGFKMSKQGRKELRRILFMVAMTAIRSNPLIREIYERHLGRGKTKMDAVGVCMHKILRVVYGMLKNRMPFDPQIDKNNRKKAIGKAAEQKEYRSRRYQGFDPAAPISGRQNKKRLERKEPHCADDTTCGVIAPAPEPSR